MKKTKYYTIIVRFKAKSFGQEELRNFLESIIPIALQSPGCLRHDLHQSMDNPSEFLFYENWTDKEAHEKHIHREEVQKWRSSLDNFLEKPYEVSIWKTL